MLESTIRGTYARRRIMVPAIFIVTCLVLPLSPAAAEEESIATLRQMGRAFASIAEKASPAVVGVRATRPVPRARIQRRSEGEVIPFDEEDLYRYFFGPESTPRRRQTPQEPPTQIAQGSGFIISSDGYILTNNHMVGGAESVTVQLADGRQEKAEIIGADADTDVAVIKIDEENLPYIELANSDALEVGEWVVAIGNPFGLSHTVTAGIVSAKGRADIGIAEYEDLIQTDAAINLGNSGGPLLNLNGQAVGMNTAIIGPGGNVGIGLAIPSNMALDIYTQFKESGKVVRGFLGVSMVDIVPDMMEFFNLDEAKGVLIQQVVEGSSAERAGIEQGDVIVELDGELVDNANTFRNRIVMHKPNSQVEIVVIRDGGRRTLTATLDAVPEDAPESGPTPDVRTDVGMTVQTLTEELAEGLEYQGLAGVVITEVEPGSPAAAAGLEREMLIQQVNREPVGNVREFNRAMDAARQRSDTALLLVRAGTLDQYVLLDLSE